MGLVGVLSGSIIMKGIDLAGDYRQQTLKNKFGQAVALISDKIAFICRHSHDPAEYILPHLINHQANLQALKDLGVSEVVGINSTGSLKKELHPGMIFIPDDFIALTPTPSVHRNLAIHITPSLDEKIRQKLIFAARQGNMNFAERGTYWQTAGPRLETKAEIKMMGNFADVVGMTMANEAVIAQELGLPYASACSIDNYANGIVDKPLSLEEIIAGTTKNAALMIRLIKSYIEER